MTTLAGLLMCYNEIKTGNIARCLDSLVRYCDYIVLYDDGSTDGTPDYAETFLKASIGNSQLIDYVIIRSTKNDFENELQHKQEQIEIAKQIGATWAIRLDADETLAANGVKHIRHLLDMDIPSWAFHTINLWRSASYYRIDNGYNDVVFNRLWKLTPDMHFKIERGLHLTNYPVGVTDGEGRALIEIIHWGFASDQAIVDKYNMYRDHGQAGWALNRLIDESTLQLRRSNPAWFTDSLPVDDFDTIFASPVAEKVSL